MKWCAISGSAPCMNLRAHVQVCTPTNIPKHCFLVKHDTALTVIQTHHNIRTSACQVRATHFSPKHACLQVEESRGKLYAGILDDARMCLALPIERCYAQTARQCEQVVQPKCCTQVEVVNDQWLQHARCYTTTFFTQAVTALNMTCTPLQSAQESSNIGIYCSHICSHVIADHTWCFANSS